MNAPTNAPDRHSIMSATRGRAPSAAPAPAVTTGYESDYEVVGGYTDDNDVRWVISDNGRPGIGGVSLSSDVDNRFMATDAGHEYPRQSTVFGDTWAKLTAPTENEVKILVDRFAEKHSPSGGGSSDSKGGGGGGMIDLGGEDAPLDPSADGAVRPKGAKPPPPIPAYSGTMPSDASLSSIQRALIGLGYPVGSTGADGKPGPSTDAAIIKFKTAHGVSPADAAITPAFRAALSKAVAARNGASIVDSAGGTSLTFVFIAATIAAVAGVIVKKWIG